MCVHRCIRVLCRRVPELGVLRRNFHQSRSVVILYFCVPHDRRHVLPSNCGEKCRVMEPRKEPMEKTQNKACEATRGALFVGFGLHWSRASTFAFGIHDFTPMIRPVISRCLACAACQKCQRMQSMPFAWIGPRLGVLISSPRSARRRSRTRRFWSLASRSKSRTSRSMQPAGQFLGASEFFMGGCMS